MLGLHPQQDASMLSSNPREFRCTQGAKGLLLLEMTHLHQTILCLDREGLSPQFILQVPYLLFEHSYALDMALDKVLVLGQ